MLQDVISTAPVLDSSSQAAADLAQWTQDLLVDLYDDQSLNECYQQMMRDSIGAGVHQLVVGLEEKRRDFSNLEWKKYVRLCLLHPVRRIVHQDPFTLRAFSKPRGYAGDAVLLDLIYGVDEGRGPPEGTTEQGRKVFEYTTRCSACEGVRTRARIVAEVVDRLAMNVHRPEILSVAAGHLREAGMSGALKQRRIGRWVAFDADTDSLQEVRRSYASVETAAATVRQLLSGRIALGEFDFIYSTGLYDYLQQPLAKRLTTRLFEMLRPGGQLLIANFLTGIPQRGYMESFMDWQLVYREHPQMLDLAMAIDRAKVKDIHLWTEDGQAIVFLNITKK